MERFYREGADFPVINAQIKDALKAAIANVPERRAIRVLEVGAGTSSLTSKVLDVFPADRTEYVFSDNGPLFLQTAEEKFGEKYHFVEYKMFDCEKDPEHQVGLHKYDIVLASNVVHATADLKETLKNLQRCLAPNGILMFLEVTWRRAALDNVFGLLGGWWRICGYGPQGTFCSTLPQAVGGIPYLLWLPRSDQFHLFLRQERRSAGLPHRSSPRSGGSRRKARMNLWKR